MKNVKSFLLACLATTALLCTGFTIGSLVQTAKVDTQNSIVNWTGYKTTGKHTGTVKLKSGSLSFTDDKLTSGSFEMDMNSIKCTDLEGDWAQKMEAQLKNDDFFGVAHYPLAKFVITRTIPQDTKGNYRIIGNLTIKETTKEVKFFGNVTSSGNQVNASCKMTIDRSEFNVRLGSGSFFDGLADKTIYDEFDLDVKLVATKE